MDEAGRFDAAVREATTGAWAQRYWTGEHLLLEGISRGPGATDATCDLTTSAKAQADTIASVLPATFAIRDFRMFECGSALPACAGDVIPGAPVQALCSRLEASPGHSCGFTSLPTDGHLTCHAGNHDRCRAWLEGRLPP